METNTQPALNELGAALAKAQVELTNPKKSRTVKIKSTKGNYSYSYAELDTIIDHVRVPLAKNGLSIIQFTAIEDGKLVLMTRLLHSGGQFLQSVYPLPAGASAQEMGSAITYGRRYCIGAMLFLAAEDDEDGKLADGAGGGEDTSDRDNLVELMGEASLGNKAVMDFCRAQKIGDGDSVEALPADVVRKLVDQWPAVVKAIKSAPKAAPANTTPAAPPPAKEEAKEELPGLPDLTGLAPELATAMGKAGVSKAQLKAYYVGAKHLPDTVEPEKLPPTYLKQLLAPANWKKAVEHMTNLV